MAARKLNRPVRLLYDRATDTLMVGKRHPYLGDVPHRLHARRHDRRRCSLDLQLRRRRHLRLLVRRDGPEPAPVRRLLPGRDASRPTAPSTAPTRPATPPSARSAPSSRRRSSRTRSSTWRTSLSQTLGRRVLPEEIRRKNLYRTGIARGLRPDPLRAGPASSATSARSGTSLYRVVGVRDAGRGGRGVQPGEPLAEAGHRHDPAEVRHRLHRAARLAERLERPGQRQHGGRVGGRPPRRRRDGAGPAHQDRAGGREHAGHPARIDPRRRQQQRRDRQRPGHGRLDRLRPQRRGRRARRAGCCATGSRISAATWSSSHPHDCIERLAIRLGGHAGARSSSGPGSTAST